MRGQWFSGSWLSALILAVAAAGCTADRSPTEPVAAPQYSVEQAQKGFSRVRAALPAAVGSSAATRLIGTQGGVLERGGHRLTVPEGAVAGPTFFTLEVLQDGFIEVRLTATSAGSRVSNDVGAAGFLRPLRLELSYEQSSGALDPGRLRVVWVRDDGVLEPMPGAADPALRTVSGALDHFTRYAIATN